MSHQLHIREICKQGEATFGSSKWTLNIIFVVFAGTLALFGFFVSHEYIGEIVGSLAIFTGFYFTLIVYVTDKTVGKINEISNLSVPKPENTTPEETEGTKPEAGDPKKVSQPSQLLERFKTHYREFSKNIIAQISYSIILSLSLIFITFLTQLKFTWCLNGSLNGLNQWYLIGISFLFLFVTLKLVYLILLIISNMQSFFLEELKKSHEILM